MQTPKQILKKWNPFHGEYNNETLNENIEENTKEWGYI